MSVRRGSRRLVLAAAVAVLAWLTLWSPVRRIGDGPEYVAMALQLAALRRPSLGPDDTASTLAYLKEIDGGFGVFTESFHHPRLEAADGRRDFPHFWFYPLLAAPGVALAQALHLHPNTGFTLVNLVLFSSALWIVAGVLGWAGALLLFASPILWWIDKAHTEVFTFSLLAVGLALLDHAPWWTLLAFAAASTQNAPIALALPLLAAVAVARRPELLRDHRFAAAVAASTLLALLHPLYYWRRLGVAEPQTLVGGAHLRIPGGAALAAYVWDPNLGILPHFPALAVAAVGALLLLALRAPRVLVLPPVVLPVALAALFALAFAQTTNFNSGGTPGPARYGLWFIPLAIPLLRCANRYGGSGWRRMVAALAMCSAMWSLALYRPSRPEVFRRPTWLASVLWERLPWLDNPLPEVFVERVTGYDITAAALIPAATPSCAKVLLIGGQWPRHCSPSAIPAACAAPEAFCYANRRPDGGYGFWRVGG